MRSHPFVDGMKFSFHERWNSKSGVTDYPTGNFQDVTDDEVSKLLCDLERMVPQHDQKWIDWDQPRRNKEPRRRKLW